MVSNEKIETVKIAGEKIVSRLNSAELELINGFLRGLEPDPIITVSEWANTYRILPPDTARPGKFKMEVTPYNKEISDRLSVSDPAQIIVFKKSSQIGATETGNNWLGYTIDVAPCPFLYVMPTDAMMKKTSKTRIQRMIESTPRLNEKIKPNKSKDSGNTITEKYFDGGSVTMIGANSPVGLASTAIRNVYLDEIDRYPMNVGGEGSALSLAKTRTNSFGNTKKIFITSTPTLKNESAIDLEYQKTGQREYHVPCPHCKHEQVLVFEQLRYNTNDYLSTKYECIECKELIPERHKTWMLQNGKWKAKYPEKENGIVYGYHLNAMYSPYGMYSWREMAEEYEDSRGDTPKRIAFVNTKLGEVYEEDSGDKPSWETLYDRSHSDNNTCKANKPMKSVAFITAGVDVQADRIELEIVGWMKNKQSQQIDYRVIFGNTDNDEVWNELSKVVSETWEREDGFSIPLRLMAIDTGYNTHKVYDFVKKHSASKVIPIKGRDKLDMIFTPPKNIEISRAGKKIGTVKVYGVGVSIVKSEVYGFLKQSIDLDSGEVPTGYCFFPKRDPSYFRGLTAEEIMQVTNKKGFTQYEWVKKYARNEPLDCRVYARTAAAVVGSDRWSAERWDQEIFSYDEKKQSASKEDVKIEGGPAKPKKPNKFLDHWS